MARTVNAMGRLALDKLKHRDEMELKLKGRIAAAGEKLTEAAREGGLSEQAEARIRAALMEIAL